MQEFNPYEAPQSDLHVPSRAVARRNDVARASKLLTALQLVLVIGIASCLLLGPQPSNWVWRFLWSLLLGLALNSALLVLLAGWNRAWALFGSYCFALLLSGLMLVVMLKME